MLSNISLKNWTEGSNNGQTFFLIFGFTSAIFIFASYVQGVIAGLKASITIHSRILDTLIDAPVNLFFDITPIGRIINRLTHNQEEIDFTIPICLTGLVALAFGLGGTLFLCTIYIPISALIIPFIIYLCYKIQQLYLAASRELRRLEHNHLSPVISNFEETLRGNKVIRCHEKMEEFVRKNRLLTDNLITVMYYDNACETWVSIYMEYAIMVMKFVMIACLIGLK